MNRDVDQRVNLLKNHLARCQWVEMDVEYECHGKDLPPWLSGRYWVFNFMGHSRSAVVLAYFITLFIGALMTFYPLRVCACVCVLTQLWPTLTAIVCVCLSSVHGGVCPRPLRVSRHVPVRAWVGGAGLLQWWVHLTPKPAFSQAKFVPKWPSKPVRLAELAEKRTTVLTCAPVSKLLRFVSSLLSKHSQRNR